MVNTLIMKKILSYGALATENGILKEKIQKLKKTAKFLLEESCIQSKVIGQLKQLNESRSSYIAKTKPNPGFYCNQGHFLCKIDHARYSWLNQAIEVATDGRNSGVKPLLNQCDDRFHYKRLSKKIDQLQSKYGLPSCFRNKLFVASSDTVLIQDVPTAALATQSFKKSVRNYRMVLSLIVTA